MRRAWILAGLLLLAGCSSAGGASGGPAPVASPIVASSPTVAPAPVFDWYTTDPIAADVSALRHATSVIVDAIRATDMPALKSGCRTLKSAVVTFEADTPAPDAAVRANFARAMDHYSTAATECIGGNYDASGNDLIAGNKFAAQATARITALGP